MMKIIGTILAFTGGIIAFIASLAYFFEERFMHHFTYNQMNAENSKTMAMIGLGVFSIAIITLVLTLFASKYRYPKLFYITYIIFGAILLTLLPFLRAFPIIVTFIAALLILSGGVVGDIAVALDRD